MTDDNTTHFDKAVLETISNNLFIEPLIMTDSKGKVFLLLEFRNKSTKDVLLSTQIPATMLKKIVNPFEL